MKKYLQDLFAGFILGLILFIIATVSKGGVGFLLGEFFYAITPSLIRDNLLLSPLIYIILVSIIPFALYTLSPSYRKNHDKKLSTILFSFLLFLIGFYILYFLFILAAAYAFRNFGF